MANPIAPKNTAKKVQPRKAATVVKAEPLPGELEHPVAGLHAVPTPEPEGDLPEGAVRVPIGDGSVVVLDQDDWPSSAIEAILERRFNAWASKALHTDADVAFWLSIDPTRRQVDEFFRIYNEACGIVLDDPRITRRTMLTIAK